MSLHNNTVPQVLYNTPDPHSQPSELYKINGTVLATATDPVKCWVIHEEHGVWDEVTTTFENRATTLLPSEPQHCLSLDDLHDEIKKQVMVRVRGGFKYQMEWYPYEPPFLKKPLQSIRRGFFTLSCPILDNS
jgi:hypothetical protein